MMDAYENDEKKPKIEVVDDVFAVTFYSRLYINSYANAKNSYVNTENSYVNVKNSEVNEIDIIKEKYPKLRKTSLEIIKLILENKNITQEEIAINLNKTKNAIYKNLKKLRELGIIERIGADKNGYWKIKL